MDETTRFSWPETIDGQRLTRSEAAWLAHTFSHFYSRRAVLLGSPAQQCLLESLRAQERYVVSPQVPHDHRRHVATADWRHLPFVPCSADLLIIAHGLSHVRHPRQMLREAYLLMQPQAYLIVLEFNPCSVWGLRRLFGWRQGRYAAHGRCPSATRRLLRRSHFAVTAQYRLSSSATDTGEALRCAAVPFGDVYVMLAKRKKISLMPGRPVGLNEAATLAMHGRYDTP